LACTSLIVLDDGTFVSGGKDALLNVWEKDTKINSRSLKAHNYVLYDMISLCNGAVLATASRDKSIKLWDTTSWKVISKIDLKNGGHKHSVNALLKQNEYSFVSCSDDAKMIEWHLNF
jgi:WD40 repeat protein